MAEKIIDACCLINLYASAEQEALFESSGHFYVSEYVKNESLWIRELDPGDSTKLVPKEIDLNDAITRGHITVCPLEGEREVELFVQFAVDLDDGEASSLAIALSRGWTLATDDKKGRRLATEHNVKFISTSEIIHQWVNSNSIPEAAVSEILNRIQQFGKFRPRRIDPLYEWWTRLLTAK